MCNKAGHYLRGRWLTSIVAQSLGRRTLSGLVPHRLFVLRGPPVTIDWGTKTFSYVTATNYNPIWTVIG